MGYRSDAAVVLSKEGAAYLKSQISMNGMKCGAEKLLAEADDHIVDPTTASELWYWEYIKWYNDYADVNFLERTVHSLPSEDFMFIRVGEDNSDNEEIGNYFENPFNLNLCRHIDYAYEEKK